MVRGLELGPEGVTIGGIWIGAIPCFETPEKLPGDKVTVLHLKAEGLHVVHLGDLGHSLSESDLGAPSRG